MLKRRGGPIPALAVFTMLALASAESAGEWPRHTIDNSSRGADGVRLCDINDDGRGDIVTGWEEGGLTRFYLHPGPGRVRQPWPAVTVGKTTAVEDAVFADLDDDGRWDVLSSCEGRTRAHFVFWSPGNLADLLDTKQWIADVLPATRGRQMWMFAVPLQIDGRGPVDVVVGSKGANASVGWLQAPARPRQLDQWSFHHLDDAGWIMSLVSLDMDKDGDLDVLLSDRKGARSGVRWLENPGAHAVRPQAEWPVHIIGGEDQEMMFLDTGDLDGDGVAEVVAADRQRGIVVFHRGDGAASAWQSRTMALPDGCGTAKAVAVGDLDDDGNNDIVFSCEAARDRSGVRWLRSVSTSETPTWPDVEISGRVGTKFDRIELIDLDDDGDLDVLTCEEAENLGVIWYENPSTSSRRKTGVAE